MTHSGLLYADVPLRNYLLALFCNCAFICISHSVGGFIIVRGLSVNWLALLFVEYIYDYFLK